MRVSVVLFSVLGALTFSTTASAKCAKPAKAKKIKFESGALKSESCRLTDGSKHGEYAEWAENGTLIAKGSYDKDKQVGSWETWHPNGAKKEVCEFKRGERVGECSEWHANGKQMSASVWNDGHRDGPWNLWNEDGVLIEDGSYIADFSQTGLDHRHAKLTRFYDTGEKKLEAHYDHGDASGDWIEWHKNGAVKRVGEKRGNRFSGEVNEWHDTGRKAMTGTYREGMLTGEVSYYARSGRLYEQAGYREGARHGLVTVFNKASEPIAYQCFQYGERQWVSAEGSESKRPKCPGPFAVMFKPEIQEGRDFSDGLAAVKIGGKWGYINENGGVAISPQFQNVRYFSRGISGATTDGSTWYAIDKTGTKVASARVPSASAKSSTGGISRVSRSGTVDYTRYGKSLWASTEGPTQTNPALFRASKDGKWGFIDAKGAVAIPFEYEYAGSFSDGLAAVGIGGRVGYVNGSGEVVIAAIYTRGRPFYCGIAVVQQRGEEPVVIDRYGLTVNRTEFSEVHDCVDGLARVKVDQNYGFLHMSGRMMINPRFDDINDFQGGFAAVPLDYQYIDRTGRSIFNGVVAMSPFSEDMAMVNKRGDDGDHFGILKRSGAFTEIKGEVTLSDDPRFEAVSDGMALMRLKKGVGYVSVDGTIAVETKYVDGRSFSEGLAATKLAAGWGFIDKKGSVVVEHGLADVGDFNGGVARASDGKAWGYINKSGDWVVKPAYDAVEDWTNGLARVTKGGSSSYVNASGAVVWSADK
jgi:antitoxin component YwqK of YwqJK toxin-antitoxin module